MDLDGIINSTKETAIQLNDAGALRAAASGSFSFFINHPFIVLGGLLLFIAICVIAIKQMNDNWETGMQNFTFRKFIGIMVFILTLAFLFAMDLGIVTVQAVSGWFT